MSVLNTFFARHGKLWDALDAIRKHSDKDYPMQVLSVSRLKPYLIPGVLLLVLFVVNRCKSRHTGSADDIETTDP